MTTYYILYLSYGCFYILFSKVVLFNDGRKIRAWLYGSILFLLIAFRHPSMGIDLGYGGIGYLSDFQFLSSLSFSEICKLGHYIHYEPGYIWFNWTLGLLFGSDYQVLLIACAFISLVPIAYLFYKESVSLELSYIIYISLQSFLICFSGLRQGMAVGICALSYFFILRHKPVKFACTVFAASLIHSSAILFFIAYPAYYIRIPKKYRWQTLLLVFFVFVFKYPLFAIFSKLLKAHAIATEASGGTFFVVFCFVYLFCFLFAEDNEKNNGLLNLTLLACLCLAFTEIYSTAMRASYCFLNITPLILPIAIRHIHNENFKLVCQIIVILAFALLGLNALSSSSWSGSNPYLFFWESRSAYI